MSRLNPSMQTAEIGIRKMEALEIWPLSIPDQVKLSGLVTEALRAFFDPKASVSPGSKDQKKEAAGAAPKPRQMEEVLFIDFMVDLIRTNLVRVLQLTTDYTTEVKAAALLKKITNDQAVAIARIIYEQNYRDSVKNAIGLFREATTEILTSINGEKPEDDSLKRQLQQSLNDTPSSGSRTSSGSDSKTEA